LAAGQLRLAYQPIISTHSGRVAGAEALLRWDHPERGPLLPAQFLHLAEESGAIVPIGDWVIRQACLDTRAWLDSGPGRARVQRARQRRSPAAAGGHVRRARAGHRAPDGAQPGTSSRWTSTRTRSTTARPGNLRARAGAAPLRCATRARQTSGSGISSLTALRTCEADVLKLDGTVARMLGTSGDDDPIVRAIIQLAHALDMQVVAEWVTSADQLRRLRMLGCDLVQGHLLGEPTAADVFGSRTGR
jgi:EAL domain-containing protein (putative c-di-GMP-specific phosphodiesterase class I)